MSPPQGCGDSSTTGDRRDTKHRWGTMSPFFCASPAGFLPKKKTGTAFPAAPVPSLLAASSSIVSAEPAAGFPLA